MPCKHDLNSQQFWHSEIGRICQTKKSPWKKSIQLYWSSNDAPMWRHFACSLKKEDGKLRGDIKLLTKWHDNGALLLDQFLQKSTCILLKSENLMWGLRVSHLYHLYNMAIWMLEFLSKNKVKAFQLQLKGFSYCWTHILLLISLFYGS